MPAYSSTQLVVTFHPPAAQRAKGFASKQPEAEEEARLFDYVVQASVAARASDSSLGESKCMRAACT